MFDLATSFLNFAGFDWLFQSFDWLLILLDQYEVLDYSSICFVATYFWCVFIIS